MRARGVPWMRAALLLTTVLSAAPVPAQETAPPRPGPALTEVSREIAREPEYRSRAPLYGLYLFGPQARTRVWAILDCSREDAESYDILHFDRDADGDLTDAGERIEAHEGTFDIGSFRDPGTGEEHTDLQIQWETHDDGSWVFFSMQWRGKVQVKGGYAVQPGPYAQFASSPEKAPVFWPGAEGPLGFQPWMLPELAVGEDRKVKVFLGHPGVGSNTFCGLTNEFLPEEIPVLATLIYADLEGQEREARYRLQDRC